MICSVKSIMGFFSCLLLPSVYISLSSVPEESSSCILESSFCLTKPEDLIFATILFSCCFITSNTLLRECETSLAVSTTTRANKSIGPAKSPTTLAIVL